jgi:hypothetical protein
VFIDPDLLQYDEVWAAAGTWNDVFGIEPHKLVEASGGAVTNRKREAPRNVTTGTLQPMGERPILHLSLPVSDLEEARGFYVDVLGCRPGRVRDDWFDVWFFGMQLTLIPASAERSAGNWLIRAATSSRSSTTAAPQSSLRSARSGSCQCHTHQVDWWHVHGSR